MNFGLLDDVKDGVLLKCLFGTGVERIERALPTSVVAKNETLAYRE